MERGKSCQVKNNSIPPQYYDKIQLIIYRAGFGCAEQADNVKTEGGCFLITEDKPSNRKIGFMRVVAFAVLSIIVLGSAFLAYVKQGY